MNYIFPIIKPNSIFLPSEICWCERSPRKQRSSRINNQYESWRCGL